MKVKYIRMPSIAAVRINVSATTRGVEAVLALRIEARVTPEIILIIRLSHT